MKRLLLSLGILAFGISANAQNINDNRVNFQYIQLPYMKIDKAFTNYDIVVNHDYRQANEDSIQMKEMIDQVSMDIFMSSMDRYQRQVDSIDRIHLRNMAAWEVSVNAGTTQANGQALPQPVRPAYPIAPSYPRFEPANLHPEIQDDLVKNSINIAGFEKGLGGFVVTVNIQPLRDVRIKQTKKGSGSSTKYVYTASYVLPIQLTVESPTQGKLIHMRINDNTQSYSIGEYKSKYDFDLYMKDNKADLYAKLHQSARTKALSQTNNYLNDQIGYVQRSRNAEFYSVKRFKDYDYSDVTAAYTKSVQALNLVGNDRDRSGAISAIDDAIAAWNEIMHESNTYDNKARINDKITAMIQCNLAELMVWKGDFANSELNINLAVNAGGKFKRHANGEKSFYADQKKRWQANQ